MYEYSDQSHSPRVMIYSQDGFGLGHMRRNSSIANLFLQTLSTASVLTLSDSQLGQLFSTAQNQDYLKLPSIVKDGPGQWRATNLSLSFASVRLMRRELIRTAALSYWPNILLVDHMPHGAMGELVPALDALKAAGADTKIVLGLRDILDAPKVVQERWRVEGAFEIIEQYYDLVLVYGMREVFDVAEQYYFPPHIAEKLCYCGYVCTPGTARYAARARAQSLAGAQKGSSLIVAMAGGGADAYPMMSALLAALPEILAHQPCVLVLITGPFMPAELRHDLEKRGRGLPVRVRMSVDDTLSYLEAADLVVAMAGYNTTIEILRSGKRAILIPRAGPSAEQRTRAKLFSARHWVEMIDPDDLDPELVAERVIENLRVANGSTVEIRPDLDGAQSATEQLLALLPVPAELEGIRLQLAEEYLNGLSF